MIRQKTGTLPGRRTGIGWVTSKSSVTVILSDFERLRDRRRREYVSTCITSLSLLQLLISTALCLTLNLLSISLTTSPGVLFSIRLRICACCGTLTRSASREIADQIQTSDREEHSPSYSIRQPRHVDLIRLDSSLRILWASKGFGGKVRSGCRPKIAGLPCACLVAVAIIS